MNHLNATGLAPVGSIWSRPVQPYNLIPTKPIYQVPSGTACYASFDQVPSVQSGDSIVGEFTVEPSELAVNGWFFTFI